MPPLPPTREHTILKAARRAAEAASLRYPDAAQYACRITAAPPCMRCRWCVGFAVRGERQVRHAEYRDSHGAGDRATANCAPARWSARSSSTSAAAPPASATSMQTTGCRRRRRTWSWSPARPPESARLLLNSKHRLFPNGLGNRFDWVGRNFQGHTYTGAHRLFRGGRLRRSRAGRGHRDLRLQPWQSGLKRRRHARERVHPAADPVSRHAAARHAALGKGAQGRDAQVLSPHHRGAGSDAGDAALGLARAARPQGEGPVGHPGAAHLRRQAPAHPRDRHGPCRARPRRG